MQPLDKILPHLDVYCPSHNEAEHQTGLSDPRAILDAYRVLFRNGPTGGDLADVRVAKTLVAGTNQVSIDAYGTSFFDGLKPADVDWLVEAAARGMGEIDPGKLNIKTADA